MPHSLNYESLLRLGRFEEVARVYKGSVQRAEPIASVDGQLAAAEALARIGNTESALSIVQRILDGCRKGLPVARCELVLGLVARDQGLVAQSLKHFRHSARLARDAGGAKQEAEALLAEFRILSERESPHVISPLLEELRRRTTRAGDPHLTALLHESVARHEAQVGHLDEARRHLKIATGLLQAHPNVWLEQLCEINWFCVEFSDCNFAVAQEHISRAKDLVLESGALEHTISNNLGHLLLQTGRFRKAEEVLLRLTSSREREVRDSALDGLARLYLATNRLEECQSTLNQLVSQAVAERTSSSPSRARLATRIRLYLRQGRWKEAADFAETAIEDATNAGDRQALATALFLRARAQVESGLTTDASRSMSRAVALGAWDIREHQGLFLRICAELQNEHDLARAELSMRAERVWRVQGNACAMAEFSTPTQAQSEQQPQHIPDGFEPYTLSIIGALASVFDVAYSPALLGTELLSMIERTRCSPSVRLSDPAGSSREPSSRVQQSRLSLGEQDGRALELICAIPDEPARAILLSDILRLGRSAIALERAREEERSRAALWPADPLEDQTDAIFLSERMRELLDVARRVARTDAPVLVTGETGTGKEVFARTIHAYSNNPKSPFVPFNCTSTPKDMLDSQLFGHRRGAFTGATDNFQGVIRAAAGGTLFLDEIGDMGLEVQPKLLRFLESHEVHPIGEARPAHVDVRVIVATNADLDTMVAQGQFREDLFYRLNIVRIDVPPLRERRVEIPVLASHYLRKYAVEYERGDLRLAEETMEYLVLYRWPGNVRQLASEMRKLAVMAEAGAVLMPEHLSPDIAASRRTIPPSARALDPQEIVVRLDQPIPAAFLYVEERMVSFALERCGGRVEDAAAMLGLSRKGLYLKRQRLGLTPPGKGSSAATRA